MAASSGECFATLTHARLRAVQGDVAGAVRILRAILAVEPEHGEAKAMLSELAPASSRIGRLSAWLLLLQRNRGARDAR